MNTSRRVLLTLEYDGTAYAGWQRQENALAIQQVVEDALEELTGESIVITGASRTDAGVHAMGQNAHFDTHSSIPDEKFSFALNTMLSTDIRVRKSESAAADFHARFSAVGKVYRYRIHRAPHASAIERNTAAHVIYPLDLDLMAREAQSMLGTHDFTAFAASGSEAKTTVRTMRSIAVRARGERVEIWIEGDGFLYNMVRILAGTLIGVGSGKLPPGAITRAIETRDRLQLGVTAPPHGLTLMRVCYDDRAVGEYFALALEENYLK